MPARKSTPTLILAVISFGVFVAADDLTVVSTMLRQIIFDLEIPLPEGLDDAAWIVNAYLIAYVVVMPFVGRVSDILGRRPVYIGALVLFLAGSIWIPLATSLEAFIVGRVITALGGGAMVPVGMAIIGDVYQARRRPSALGTLGAVDTAGWVWGPLYGALLVRFLDWRWQFYLNIPLSLIGIGAAWWALRDLPKPKGRTRLDWLGMAVLTGALLALNIALLNSGHIQSVGSLSELTGDDQASTLPLYLVAAVLFLLFIVVEGDWGGRILSRMPANLQSRDPLIDLRLFLRPNFSPAVVVNFLVGAILIIAMINVPLLVNVLEFEVGRAAIVSGLLLSAMTISMAVMAYVGGRLTERWNYRPVTMLGLVACVVGFGLMGLTWSLEAPYRQMVWQLMILGAGFGLVIAPISAAVINAAPDDQRGIASSLVIVFRLMGMSVGLSGLTAWGLYRFGLLRAGIKLPDLTDPGFQEAVVEALTSLTVSVLAETFLIWAALAAVALVVASRLREEKITVDS